MNGDDNENEVYKLDEDAGMSGDDSEEGRHAGE